MTADPVLILGARSDMARALARRLARAGHPLMLAGRNAGTLADDAADLATRYGALVTWHEVDAVDIARHATFLDGLPVPPRIAVSAVGRLGEPSEAGDPDAAATILRANFEGPALLLAEIARRMAAAGGGVVVGISSVAGERGRGSNWVYGSAKAGFTAALSGLRNRHMRDGVHVVTVLPGFVATRMTEGMALPPLLTAEPDEVAAAIERAIARRQNVVYVRPVWRMIMAAIRLIPEPIFKRLKL